ncbi:MAG: hypothetical protein HQ538_00260, partial [Parcubacteria group bacterium]|nr:hypothetical protein [Parcubacteria group bacterium]
GFLEEQKLNEERITAEKDVAEAKLAIQQKYMDDYYEANKKGINVIIKELADGMEKQMILDMGVYDYKVQMLVNYRTELKKSGMLTLDFEKYISQQISKTKAEELTYKKKLDDKYVKELQKSLDLELKQREEVTEIRIKLRKEITDKSLSENERELNDAKIWRDQMIRDVEDYGMATERVLIQIEKGYQNMLEDTKEASDEMAELSKELARDMQDNFSDLFFDMFTGELKSIEDYFKAFTNSLIRAWSDMIAKMIVESLKLDQVSFGDINWGKLFNFLPVGGGGTSPIPGEVSDVAGSVLAKRSLAPEGSKTFNYITNNYIKAIDTKSFDEALRNNDKSILGIVASSRRNQGMI